MKPLMALAVPLLMVTAACTPDVVEPKDPTIPPTAGAGLPVDDTCGAERYADLIGQRGITVSIPEGTPHRSYQRGDALTMDMVPARLNFEHDASGRLISVSCG